MVSMGVVFCILVPVIIQNSLVLSMQILQDSSDKFVKKKGGLSYRRFKRQVDCPTGEYPGEHHCCKLCKKGTYVEFECKEAHGESKCQICNEEVDFMDEESGYPKCHKCQPCESAAGQEVLHKCTVSKNTVCKCKDGFFCSDSPLSPNGNCNRCRHCTVCNSGIAESCTSTKDTVCNAESTRVHTILWPIVAVVIVAIVFGVLWYRRRHAKTVNISGGDKPLIDHKPTCPPHLENIDLENHLYDISGIMERESILKLVMKKLTPAEREVIQRDNIGNAREEKYELLKRWYIVNGCQGALKIILENAAKRETEKILDLFKEENAEP